MAQQEFLWEPAQMLYDWSLQDALLKDKTMTSLNEVIEVEFKPARPGEDSALKSIYQTLSY